MSILRQDPTTGGWVLIAPGRRHRPHEHLDAAPRPCPLCPGQEDQSPEELLRFASSGGDGWALRVVPNRFPVLSPTGGPAEERSEAPLFLERDGVGHHELVIDTARHDARMSEMTDAEVARVFHAYHARYLELRCDLRVAYVIVFKNSGERAGASLRHPHSQIVATPVAPLGLRGRYACARRHYATTDRCLYCDVVEAERRAGRRVVHETDRFVVFCPFASGVPFETWIVPKRHQPSFGATSVSDRDELGRLSRSTLAAVDRVLDRPPFNYVLHTSPVADEGEPYYLWHLQILPRVSTFAGFELGSGIPIDTVPPEEAAQALRGAWGR